MCRHQVGHLWEVQQLPQVDRMGVEESRFFFFLGAEFSNNTGRYNVPGRKGITRNAFLFANAVHAAAKSLATKIMTVCDNKRAHDHSIIKQSFEKMPPPD